MVWSPTGSRRVCVGAVAAMFCATSGCSATTLIMPNPPEASVRVDGKPLPGDVLKYGRWIGNSYTIEVSAPKFRTQQMVVSPKLGDRAGAYTFVCLATVIGIPLLPAVFWNGELDERIYVSLEPAEP